MACIHTRGKPFIPLIFRFREMANVVRDRKRSEVIHRSKVERATEAASNASTQEEMEGVIYSNDVVDLLCGPAETKIRQLQRELRDEKLQHQRTRRFALCDLCVYIIQPPHTHLCRKLQISQSELSTLIETHGKKVVHLETQIKNLQDQSTRDLEEALEQYKIAKKEQQEIHDEELRRCRGLSGSNLISDSHHEGMYV